MTATIHSTTTETLNQMLELGLLQAAQHNTRPAMDVIEELTQELLNE